ncbi:MAG: SOS response-associated peptidase [Solirubrobacterales bacterium]
MCGRFTVTTKDTKKIADRFQVELEKALERGGSGDGAPAAGESVKTAAASAADGGDGATRRAKSPPGMGRFNVAPTQEILVVRSSPDPEEAAGGEREARLMRWGLVPRWAKDLKVGYRMINAKAENLTSSRAYSPLVGKFRHRCLIVADGFYEWMRAEDPKQPRQPWRFTVDGGEPFAFAGICTRKEWEDEEDRGFDDGWLYSATIVTTAANDLVARVHDRMPAILSGAEAEAAWLRPDLSVEDAVAMCEPLDARRMSSSPANPKLNKVGKGMEEGPELLVAPWAELLVLVFFFVDRLGSPGQGAVGPRGRRAGAGGEGAGDSSRGDVGGFPDRGERQLQLPGRRPRWQEPLPALHPNLVGGPFQLDAGFAGEAALEEIAHFDDGEFGALGAEPEQRYLRHVLLVQLVARARVDGSKVGGLRHFRAPRRSHRAEDPAAADGGPGVDAEDRRDAVELVAADIRPSRAEAVFGQAHGAAAARDGDRPRVRQRAFLHPFHVGRRAARLVGRQYRRREAGDQPDRDDDQRSARHAEVLRGVVAHRRDSIGIRHRSATLPCPAGNAATVGVWLRR